MKNSSNDASDQLSYPTPTQRHLRVFAFDPSLDTDLDAAAVSQYFVAIPWEPLQPGPVGEYIEVVDIDPASQCVYDPVDLNHQHVLATGGLVPSEGVPQFHQQMVYGVAMKTIESFERALGRPVLWSEHLYANHSRTEYVSLRDRYVQRLRIYPHAFRGENAYYSPDKKALLFGYFTSQAAMSAKDLPGGMVFTCLSHDIVAHETTHAILDGIHRRLLRATNDDMLALHEGFGDLVAIFQHFTLPNVLPFQIRKSRGNLSVDGLLTDLAVQFGHATGKGQALRTSLGNVDRKTGERRPPDPMAIARVTEPHERGAILVAAVFDAFLEVFNRRGADLKRLASQGTGELPAGELHPDLVDRLGREAAEVAQRLLTACIRALDYLPPVDVTFGDFLRALVTADVDLAPTDPPLVRLAIIEGFRRRGIVPRDVRTLSVEALSWRPPADQAADMLDNWLGQRREELMDMVTDSYDVDPKEKGVVNLVENRNWKELPDELNQLKTQSHPRKLRQRPETARYVRRRLAFVRSRLNSMVFHSWLKELVKQADFEAGLGNRWLGADFLDERRTRVVRDIEIHAVRTRYQQRSDGRVRPEIVVLLTQRRRIESRNIAQQVHADWSVVDGVWMRGGCTLIIDPEEGRVRYAISKNIGSPYRESQVIAFHDAKLREQGEMAVGRYDFIFHEGPDTVQDPVEAARLFYEPIAALHGVHDE